MRHAVNTRTTAIATPYDYEKHPRKLRIGYYGSGRNQDEMVTTAPFFCARISATYKIETHNEKRTSLADFTSIFTSVLQPKGLA